MIKRGNLPLQAASQPASGRRAGKAVLGYTVAAGCLFWVFHDVELTGIFSRFGDISWWWVGVAVFTDICSYVCQGLRWSFLLQSVVCVPLVRTTQAIYAGLFLSEVLPMKVGEVLRTYLISRWFSVELVSVFPSILVERFFDAVWLALAFGITVFMVPLPQYLVDAEEILGVAVLAVTSLFVFFVLRKGSVQEHRNAHPRGLRNLMPSLSDTLARMGAGLRKIGRARLLYASFGVSALLLLGQIVSFWLVTHACGLELSFWQGAAVLLIIQVGTLIPSAPSNLGTYQFFAVVGLTLFGVDKTAASGFSVIVFLILTIPLWVIGSLAFAKSGLTLREIRTGRLRSRSG